MTSGSTLGTAIALQPPVQWEGAAAARFPEPSLRRIAWTSLGVIVLGLGGMLLWASLARLDSAVSAPGVIVAAGKLKTVTLQDSGILQALLVHEGDHVAAGQILLRLDQVQARTAYAQADAQFRAAQARAARLTVEAANARTLAFAPALLQAAASDATLAASLDTERHLFAERWLAFDGSVRIAARKRSEELADAASASEQIGAIATRIQLYREQLRDVETLLAKGFATRPEALELRRNIAELQGASSELAGRVAQDRETVEQTGAEIANLAENRHADIAQQRSDTQAALADAEQRRSAARDLLSRREIASPEAGTVTNIRFFTPGSSIAGDTPVLDIAPADARLLIEGSVSPNDIEHVRVGQPVNVRLTAYKAHRVPVLTGHLVYVGADRQLDAQNNPIFLVRAQLDPGALARLPGVAMYAGMPADLLILGGQRRVLDFLLSPLRDSMRHGMIEP